VFNELTTVQAPSIQIVEVVDEEELEVELLLEVVDEELEVELELVDDEVVESPYSSAVIISLS